MARAAWIAALALAAALAAAVSQARVEIAAIAHRGDTTLTTGWPENTLPAFESALAQGGDYVEVDVQTTADGVLVVIHDSTVDRTTNGTGPVSSFTFAEIRTLDAGSRAYPGSEGLRIPSFAEVAALVRSYNRSMYLDLKNAASQPLFRELQIAGMEANVVAYGGTTQLKELQDLDVRIKPMPEAVSKEAMDSYIALFDPLEVIAFNDNDFRDELIQQARAIPADVYVDRFGLKDTEPVWQDAIDRGATGIQTDRIGALVAYLRAMGYHP